MFFKYRLYFGQYFGHWDSSQVKKNSLSCAFDVIEFSIIWSYFGHWLKTFPSSPMCRFRERHLPNTHTQLTAVTGSTPRSSVPGTPRRCRCCPSNQGSPSVQSVRRSRGRRRCRPCGSTSVQCVNRASQRGHPERRIEQDTCLTWTVENFFQTNFCLRRAAV